MILDPAVTPAREAASGETPLTGQRIESVNTLWRARLAVSLDTVSPDRLGDRDPWRMQDKTHF